MYLNKNRNLGASSADFSKYGDTPPNGWEEFESIVKSAFEIKWQTSDLTMHGRQGQRQNEVDIYGHNNLGHFVGIQCKLTVNSINESIINKEIANAENFEPSLSTLYIATTSPADVNLQKYIRNVSTERIRKGDFSIGLLFWSDIIQELTKDEVVFKQHYPQLYPNPDHLTPTNSLRQRDLKNLCTVLEYIDIESIPYEIDMAPKLVASSFLCAPDYFEILRMNPSFHIYDKELSIKLNSWLDKWSEISDAGKFIYEYQYGTHNLIFPMPMDMFRNQEEAKLFTYLTNLYKEYIVLLKEFIGLINGRYHEIDFNETSTKARKWLAS